MEEQHCERRWQQTTVVASPKISFVSLRPLLFFPHAAKKWWLSGTEEDAWCLLVWTKYVGFFFLKLRINITPSIVQLMRIINQMKSIRRALHIGGLHSSMWAMDQKVKFWSLLKSGWPSLKKHLIHIKIYIYGIHSRGITVMHPLLDV